jgi:mono/diheme cytochrome c family protein
LACAAVALLASLAIAPAAAHDPITTPITFDREVRAILQARCASCHAAGGPAPMPLTTYDEVRPWARAVKDQILARRMPKWSAAHGYGAFAGDPSLTPTEMAMVAAWVDGGQPKGSARAVPAVVDPVVSAFRRQAPPLAIAVSAADATLTPPSRWIGGWSFEPGDPLITSATFASADGTPIGTWVAGDAPVRLPSGSGIRVMPPIHVQLQRRTIAGYEQPAAPSRSVLRLLPCTVAPKRRVWVEQTTCGAPRTGRSAELLAVRPLLGDRASAQVWLERPGAPQMIVGWFRDVEALYPRTFWLARPLELSPESRIAANAPCLMELTLASR